MEILDGLYVIIFWVFFCPYMLKYQRRYILQDCLIFILKLLKETPCRAVNFYHLLSHIIKHSFVPLIKSCLFKSYLFIMYSVLFTDNTSDIQTAIVHFQTSNLTKLH